MVQCSPSGLSPNIPPNRTTSPCEGVNDTKLDVNTLPFVPMTTSQWCINRDIASSGKNETIVISVHSGQWPTAFKQSKAYDSENHESFVLTSPPTTHTLSTPPSQDGRISPFFFTPTPIPPHTSHSLSPHTAHSPPPHTTHSPSPHTSMSISTTPSITMATTVTTPSNVWGSRTKSWSTILGTQQNTASTSVVQSQSSKVNTGAAEGQQTTKVVNDQSRRTQLKELGGE